MKGRIDRQVRVRDEKIVYITCLDDEQDRPDSCSQAKEHDTLTDAVTYIWGVLSDMGERPQIEIQG